MFSLTKMVAFIGSAFTIPNTIYGTIEMIIQKMMLFEYILPVSDMLYALILIMMFEMILMGVRLAISFINWIRGAGGISLDI